MVRTTAVDNVINYVFGRKYIFLFILVVETRRSARSNHFSLTKSPKLSELDSMTGTFDILLGYTHMK